MGTSQEPVQKSDGSVGSPKADAPPRSPPASQTPPPVDHAKQAEAARRFLAEQNFSAAIALLIKLTEVNDPAFQQTVTWARAELPGARERLQQANTRNSRACARARDLLKAHDYGAVIHALEAIAAGARTEETRRLLAQTRDVYEESLGLLQEIEEVIGRKKYEFIEPIVTRYLKIKPDNAKIQRLASALKQHGPARAVQEYKGTRRQYKLAGRIVDPREIAAGVLGIAVICVVAFAGAKYYYTEYIVPMGAKAPAVAQSDGKTSPELPAVNKNAAGVPPAAQQQVAADTPPAMDRDEPEQTEQADGKTDADATDETALTSATKTEPPIEISPFDGKLPGEERSDNALKLRLVWCPSGTFHMGSSPNDGDAARDETATAKVFVRGFWLGKHEVTQEQWRQVMRTTPWKGEKYARAGADFPASFVNYVDALEFCRLLEKQERKAGRLPAGWECTLPSEAQWEYACRAGSTTRFSWGDEQGGLAERGWFADNAVSAKEAYPHQIGKKVANAWGLHDMHGNMSEWCLDWYSGQPSAVSRPLQISGSQRVVRGGGWSSKATACRSSARDKRDVPERAADLGFRVAWTWTGSK